MTLRLHASKVVSASNISTRRDPVKKQNAFFSLLFVFLVRHLYAKSFGPTKLIKQNSTAQNVTTIIVHFLDKKLSINKIFSPSTTTSLYVAHVPFIRVCICVGLPACCQVACRTKTNDHDIFQQPAANDPKICSLSSCERTMKQPKYSFCFRCIEKMPLTGEFRPQKS